MDAAGEKSDHNAHVSLPRELIEHLKNINNWDDWPSRWTFDGEKMASVALSWPQQVIDDKLNELPWLAIVEPKK